MIKRNIHFIRHGQTLYNSLNKIQGSSDIKLNDIGIKQAKDVVINEAYDIYQHSGLIRSEETLRIITKNKFTLNKEELLKERGYGIFEGLTNEEIKNKYPDIFFKWKENENTYIENAETIENVVLRIKKYIKKTLEDKYEKILVVTHSGFLYALYKYMKNIDYGCRPEIYFSNCCSVHLEILYDRGNVLLKLYCDNNEIIEKSIDISLI